MHQEACCISQGCSSGMQVASEDEGKAHSCSGKEASTISGVPSASVDGYTPTEPSFRIRFAESTAAGNTKAAQGGKESLESSIAESTGF
jgi:hypothetical protein